MKFSEMLKEYIDLRMEETHHVFGHASSFAMIEKRNERLSFLEQEMDKKVLDSGEEL